MNEAHIAATAIVRSMLVNAALATVKLTAGWLGHSYALIADGIESINDVFSSGIVLLSVRVSAKPPDENYPYGHGRAEQLGALFSAISLLAAGVVIAYESSQNLIHRHTSPSWFTLPILILVIVVKEGLSRYALKKSDEVSSSALKGDAWHHRSDAITSGAAFLGIAVALIGGPGYEKADDVAALLGCVVIAVNGIKLFKDALHETMDGAPAAEFRRGIELLALSVSGVRAVEKLRVKKVGFNYHMDLHVQVQPDLTVEKGHRIAGIVKRTLLDAGKRISDVVIHLEPHY